MDNFTKIRTKVNDLIRASGLDRRCPQGVMDMVLGTSLEKFAMLGILVNGLKSLIEDFSCTETKTAVFDRTTKLRQRFTRGSYMDYFEKSWNLLPAQLRRLIRKQPSYTHVKEVLKKDRKIAFSPVIYKTYKWKKYD